MRGVTRLLMLAAILTFAVASGGATALALRGGGIGSSGTGAPLVTPAEQTHPSVLPRTGHAHTRFTASLTLADAPGHSGVLATDYRLQLTVKRKQIPARCTPPMPPSIDSGSAGEVVHIPLTAPESGWCVGRYTLTVFLQRGPYCPTPAPGQPPRPCPEFVTQELDVGQANFVVTTRH